MNNPPGWRGTIDNMYLDLSGKISCEICHATWCGHLESAMMLNRDQVVIWNLNHDIEKPGEWILEIPVFPSQGFYEYVSLIKNTDYEPRWEIYWRDESSTEFHFLGFLNRGEGRNIIRRLIIQVLYSIKVGECKASHHGFKEQQMWEMSMKGQDRAVQLWSVFKTGWCIPCAQAVRVDDSDLVPNKEGSVWNK